MTDQAHTFMVMESSLPADTTIAAYRASRPSSSRRSLASRILHPHHTDRKA